MARAKEREREELCSRHQRDLAHLTADGQYGEGENYRRDAVAENGQQLADEQESELRFLA